MAAPRLGRLLGAIIGVFRHLAARPRWAALAVVAALSVTPIGGCGTRTGPAPVYAPGEPAPPGFYRIRSGDTLSDIAVRQGIEMETLAAWNDLRPPYRILAGGLLRTAPPAAPGAAPQKAIAERSTAEEKSLPSVSSIIGDRNASKPAPPRPSAKAASPPLARERASGIAWQWPLEGRVAKGFDAGDRTRQGIRIAARPGQIVVAAASGTVGYSGGGLKGYGNLIIIKHKGDYLSTYAFNRRLLVNKGEKVAAGQPIAEVGQTTGGEFQLHFEVRKDGVAVDPLQFLPSAR